MHKILQSDCHYLPHSETAEDWGMTITTTGYQDVPAGMDYPSKNEHPSDYYFQQKAGRVLNEYQLVYITRGQGVFSSKSTCRRHIGTGDVFLLFPGEWHVYTPSVNTGWTTYWVGFKGPYPDSLFEKGFFSKESPVYSIGLHEALVRLFWQTINYSRTESPAYQQVLAGAATHLLAQVYAMGQNMGREDEAANDIITKAKIIMQENIYEHLSPEQVASSLNVSYSLFRSLFKQHTGMAPGQYQQQLRVQKAKGLLIGTTKTVKEISLILNFESDYYFSTYFKQKTGFTPCAFRKECVS